MPRVRKIVLDESPSGGELHLTQSVTFIAGPNGSGKSRLIRWMQERLHGIEGLPDGSVVELNEGEARPGLLCDYVRTLIRNSPGPWTINQAPVIVIGSPGASPETVVLPLDQQTVPGGVNIPNLVAAHPDLMSLLPQARDVTLGTQGVLRNATTNAFLPGSYIVRPRTKILSAQRFGAFSGSEPRSADLRAVVETHLGRPALTDLFALLELDPTLEIEVLARIEALTGVRVTIRKQGGEYLAIFSRVGVTNTWDRGQEADGVVALLILLPYLYSHEYDLVVIDEPEAHLYPGLQQTLRTLMYDACDMTGKQILVATHSDRLVAPPLPDFRSAVHVTIPDPLRPTVRRLRDLISATGPDSSLLNDWLQKQAFGDNQLSVFGCLFAAEAIVVEGITDLIFLDRLARYVGREYRAGSVALIEAGGKGGIARVVRFLKAMNRIVKTVVDADIVDQEGVLSQIAHAMGDTLGEVTTTASSGDRAALRDVARRYDIHILTHPGIEGFYRTHRGTFPTTPSSKREALMRELTGMQDSAPSDVRSMYPELIDVLESAARRMPEGWVDAHAAEINAVVAKIVYEWRRLKDRGESFPAVATLLAEDLRAFSRVVYRDDGTLELTHRYLQASPLMLQHSDDPVAKVRSWLSSLNEEGLG